MNVLLFINFYGCNVQSMDFAFDGNNTNSQDIVDATVNPNPDDISDYVTFVSPVFEIPPYTEVNYCTYGTYKGPDIGVINYNEITSTFTHHYRLMSVKDNNFEDGDFVECMEQGNEEIPVYSPLFEAIEDPDTGDLGDLDVSFGITGIEISPTLDSPLPDNTAFPLYNGQRWVLDLHYVNTIGKPVLVNTYFLATTTPFETIENFVGTHQFDSGPFVLPQGESEVVFECPFREDLTVLRIQSHMHEYGIYYRVEWNKSDGTVETMYEVETLDADFREDPYSKSYPVGSFDVKEGESLTTYCQYKNLTGRDLPYPAEMCTTLVMGYNILSPSTCVNGEYTD